jgi:hypothetical protein
MQTIKDRHELINILSKLNAMLVVKHGDIFNIDGKAPSWEWAIKRLDEILTIYSK